MPTSDVLSATALAERTRSLCAISSPIGQEAAICDDVERWAKNHFAPSQIRRVSHSLVLGDVEDARPTLALVGHLDTVPAHPGDGTARIEGHRVFGLGASDMKGGLAVMQALAEVLPRKQLALNLLLVLYEREEGPYPENGLEPLFAAVPALSKLRLAICMEPTDGEVQLGCVGGLHATLSFRGKSAHSARPWQGENAIHKAGELLHELHQRERTRVEVQGLEFFEVLSATLAQGGRARNVIPECFEINVNYRFAPGKSIEQAERELTDFVRGRAEVLVTDRSPSGRVCLDNPLVQRLIHSDGLAVRVGSKQAWTDVARFGVRGVDAINYGPGETAQAHQANESAPIEALEHAAKHLEKFLRSARAD